MGSDEAFQNESYVKTIEYKGYKVEIWNDDYGQSYFFKFKDRKGNLHESSCGSYNPHYEDEVHDYIDFCLFDGALMENIRKRHINTRKTHNDVLKTFYESVISKVTNLEKSGKYPLPISDELIISMIQKEVKELQETQSFLKEDDPRWRDIERMLYEAKQYLPKELSEEEVKKIICELIESGENNKGKLIGLTIKKIGNQFDKSKISSLVSDILNKQ